MVLLCIVEASNLVSYIGLATTSHGQVVIDLRNTAIIVLGYIYWVLALPNIGCTYSKNTNKLKNGHLFIKEIY